MRPQTNPNSILKAYQPPSFSKYGKENESVACRNATCLYKLHCIGRIPNLPRNSKVESRNSKLEARNSKLGIRSPKVDARSSTIYIPKNTCDNYTSFSLFPRATCSAGSPRRQRHQSLKCPRQRGDRYVLHSVAVQNAPADTDNALSSIRPRKLQDNLPQHKTTRPADTVRLLYKKFCWK